MSRDTKALSQVINTYSLLNSKKIYVSGKNFPNMHVPMREISLTDGTFFRVYDTSGPHTDSKIKVDVNHSLPDKEYKQPYKLMLITQLYNTDIDSYLTFIKKCAEGGITSLQLRDKHASPEYLFEFGYKLKQVLADFNIPLIVNDDIELAYKLDADGVHLGQTDGNPEKARKLLGPGKIIGLSIESLDELEKINNLDIEVTYVAASAVFVTKTKHNIKTIWEIDGLKEVVKLSKYPVVAIGGINQKNAAQVINAGASGIAVVSAVHEASNPQKKVQQLYNIINGVYVRTN